MNIGEDTQGLRKILDLSRMISVFLLAMHFYIRFFQMFESWEWHSDITDRIVGQLSKLAIFDGWWLAKFAALLFLAISLLGVKGRKDENISFKKIYLCMGVGLLLYFCGVFFLYLHWSDSLLIGLYCMVTITGFLLILAAGTWISRRIKQSLLKDIFNSKNETFPQEERLLENEYSVNLPARYNYKGEIRDSWINLINLFRGLLVAGTPGAGKSYFVIRHLIDQLMGKGFSMFIYDFKYDDLSVIAYNCLLKYIGRYKVKPKFYVINFDDLNRTHRCNPLDPTAMTDITDATEASRTNMIKVDLSQIEAEGDTFFSATDTAYLVFLIIGIVGYFSVPNVANYVVHAGGGNAILTKVNSLVVAAPRSGMSAATGAGGMVADALGDKARVQSQGYASAAQGDYFPDPGSHQRDKISGKKS